MRFDNSKTFTHGAAPKIGVLVTNVGSPAAPTRQALRPYLAQFLGDRRVIELPGWLWKPVLHGILLNTRPKRSARLYQNIWTEEGSPLLATLRKQAAGLQALLASRTQTDIPVAAAVRYGDPSIADALQRMAASGVRRMLIFPLFPQYSATTTATSFDAVFNELTHWRWMPELRTILHYHDHPAYISALANSIRQHWQVHGRADKLLFSFHGIPRSYFLKGDPYYCECQKTGRLLATELGLEQDHYAISFQSRLGPIEWLRPYTDETVQAWGRAGVRTVQALCPGFSADCLETVDEVAREARESFEQAGGAEFSYIPALNEHADHITALADVVMQHLAGWIDEQRTDGEMVN